MKIVNLPTSGGRSDSLRRKSEELRNGDDTGRKYVANRNLRLAVGKDITKNLAMTNVHAIHKCNGVGEPHEDQDYDNCDEEAWECLNQGSVKWSPQQSPQA